MRNGNTIWLAVLLLATGAFGGAPKDKDVPSWVTEVATRQFTAQPGRVPAVMLLNEQRIVIDASGTMTTVTQRAVKILNHEGAREAQATEFYMKGGRQVKALRAWLVGPDGFVKTIDKSSVVDLGSFSEMELYSDLRMRAIKADAPKTGDVFVSESEVVEKALFAQGEFDFQTDLPSVDSRYVLTLPSGWTATASVFNHDAVQPVVDGSTYTWELRDLPYREREGYGPEMRGLTPRLAITFHPAAGGGAGTVFESWKDVSRWSAELAEGQAEITPDLAAKVAQLTAGATTEYERIRAIANYVQKIRYVAILMDTAHGGGYKPHAAGAVFQKQYGDCKDKANLMRAMLKAAGIPSYLLAIYAGDRTFVRHEWPSPRQFNHMIIAVRVTDATDAATVVTTPAGRLLIFDPTDDTTPMGDLPWYEQSSWALLVAGDQGDLLKMPATSPEANSADEGIDASMSETGKLTALVETISQGRLADGQRALQSRDTPEQYKIQMQRSVNREGKGAVIDKLEAVDQFDQNKFVLKIEFNSPTYAQLMQQRLLVFSPSVMAPQAPTFVVNAQRQQPIILRAGVSRKKVRLKLPAGFTVDEMPTPFKEEASFGKFSVSYTQESGQLVMSEEIRTEGVTLPASRYSEVKKFFDQVYGADNQKVVLVKN